MDGTGTDNTGEDEQVSGSRLVAVMVEGFLPLRIMAR